MPLMNDVDKTTVSLLLIVLAIFFGVVIDAYQKRNR